MSIATYRGERSISEIADKIYKRLTPRQREKAEAAILKANPQLRNIRNLRKGSVLRVPDLPELRAKTNRDLDNPDAWCQYDAILERSISYTNGLYALRVLDAWGVPTVNKLAVAEACGDIRCPQARENMSF